MDRAAKNEYPRLGDLRMWRTATVAILIFAAVAFTTACGPNSPASGEWTLLMLDGSPLIAGTEISLELGDTGFETRDGCNRLSGQSRRSELIAQPDGTFAMSFEVSRTDALCVSQPGIMEQADRYARALKTGNRYEIVEGRLEIADFGGVVRLVFLKRG